VAELNTYQTPALEKLVVCQIASMVALMYMEGVKMYPCLSRSTYYNL